MEVTIKIKEKVEKETTIHVPDYFRGEYGGYCAVCPDQKHYIGFVGTCVFIYELTEITWVPKAITEEDFLAAKERFRTLLREAAVESKTEEE